MNPFMHATTMEPVYAASSFVFVVFLPCQEKAHAQPINHHRPGAGGLFVLHRWAPVPLLQGYQGIVCLSLLRLACGLCPGRPLCSSLQDQGIVAVVSAFPALLENSLFAHCFVTSFRWICSVASLFPCIASRPLCTATPSVASLCR